MKRSELTFAGYVVRIKESFKTPHVARSGGAAEQPNKYNGGGTRILRVAEGKEKYILQRGGKGTSFEAYLHTLPKLDPIDKTIRWVFHHETEESGSERKISIDKLQFVSSHMPNPFSDECALSADTSLSRCEVERGTVGRRTPASTVCPTLDQLRVRVQPAARKKTAGARPALVRQGSSHRQVGEVHAPLLLAKTTGQETVCKWKQCTLSFVSHRELYEHVQAAHVQAHTLHSGLCGRKNVDFVCEWEGCAERSKVFGARYKLLLHIKGTHCRGPLESI